MKPNRNSGVEKYSNWNKNYAECGTTIVLNWQKGETVKFKLHQWISRVHTVWGR